MMVYLEFIPLPRKPFKAGLVRLRLCADSIEDLMSYARSIGIPQEWHVKGNGITPHFLVTGRWLQFIMGDERVVKLSPKEFAKFLSPRTSSARGGAASSGGGPSGPD